MVAPTAEKEVKKIKASQHKSEKHKDKYHYVNREKSPNCLHYFIWHLPMIDLDREHGMRVDQAMNFSEALFPNQETRIAFMPPPVDPAHAPVKAPKKNKNRNY